MPNNSDFKLEILIAETPVPEYSKDGDHYVECNLSTPVSYMHQQCDVVNGEKELQSWPVTPYRIRIKASPMTNAEYPKYFRVLVDGIKVKGISLDPGESKVIKGFRDGSCIREFLFSMPRFAKDTSDRLETHRRAAVGKIVVECWDAVLRRSKWSLRSKYLDFQQANKKDSTQVTEGKYTMATSCPGKVVSGRAIHRLVDSWKLQTLRSTITLSYHMGHTLREMGFTLQSLDIPPENIRLAQRYQQEVIGQSSKENKDTAVKKEPLDIPDRPRASVPEVIDLTEDRGIDNSAQNMAMDLSLKSGDSENAPNDENEREHVSVVDDTALSSENADSEQVKTIVVDDEAESGSAVDNREREVGDKGGAINNDDGAEKTEQGIAGTSNNSTEEVQIAESVVHVHDNEQEVLEVEEMQVEHAEEIVRTETAMEETVVIRCKEISPARKGSTPSEMSVLSEETKSNTLDENIESNNIREIHEENVSEMYSSDKSKSTRTETVEVSTLDKDVLTEQSSKDETSEAGKLQSKEQEDISPEPEPEDIARASGKNPSEILESDPLSLGEGNTSKTATPDNLHVSNEQDKNAETSETVNNITENNVDLEVNIQSTSEEKVADTEIEVGDLVVNEKDGDFVDPGTEDTNDVPAEEEKDTSQNTEEKDSVEIHSNDLESERRQNGNEQV